MLPRLARSTLNELQQNQHEKASLVCVRVQSPSGVALVPCALSMVDLSGQLRCCITQASLVQKNVCVCVFFFLAPAPYARTTRYERGCFFFLGKPRKKRLASLARLIIILQSINDTLVFSLSLRRHVSLFPFLSSSLYNSLPWHTLEIPYSSSMLNPHVIGRGAPFTSRLPLVACWSLRAS